MATRAFEFVAWPHVNVIRSYASGFFNTLIELAGPAKLDHPSQYQRGVEHALVALRAWAPYAKSPVDDYCQKWEASALNDAALERRVSRSLQLSLESNRRRQAGLELEIKTHSFRSHPTRAALRSLLVRTVGEGRQITKEIAARERSPLPCLACPASVLCRDMKLACNAYNRFTALNEPPRARKLDIPRSERRPTESTTLEKMPPSSYWFRATFEGKS